MPDTRLRLLRYSLRAIVLTTPIVLDGCGAPAFCSSPAQSTQVYSLSELDGGGDASDCFAVCGVLSPYEEVQGCFFEKVDGGKPGVSCSGVPLTPPTCGLGRRPASLLESVASRSTSAVGDYFARAARLEAAAARAFRILAHELSSNGAPSKLVREARRSANEESRHALITRKLARRFGAVPDDASFGPTPSVRPLEDVAVENAAEGCVRETYGAAVCWWQAERARDPSIARAMARIAREETSHAQLSWDLAAWAEPRLTRAARARVAHARSRALEELCVDVDRDVSPVLVMLAGLPPRPSARELLRRVGRDVIAAREA